MKGRQETEVEDTIEWLAGAGLAGLAAIDVKTKQVPVAAVALLGAGLFAVRLAGGTGWPELLAGLLPGLAALVLSWLTAGKLGRGDGLVLLALGIGFGAERTLLIWWVGLLAAAFTALVLLALKRAGRNTALPFLPYLLFGYLVCLAAG